jgi:hypothetical protein
MNDTRIRLAEQNLASFKARLRTTAAKDAVRRQIAATARLLRELKGGEQG